MPPQAGYAVVIEVGGTPTAVTGEATTNVTGNIYQITSTAKRVWDPTVAIVVKDGGTPVTPTTIDWMFGKVTLPAPPGGAVTVDVTYIPRLAVVLGKSMSLDVSTDALDASVFGSRDRTYVAGLRTATCELSTYDVLTTDLDSGGDTWTWRSKSDGTLILVSIDTSGVGTEYIRFWSRVTAANLAAAVDSIITGDLSLQSTAIIAADGSVVAVGYGT